MKPGKCLDESNAEGLGKKILNLPSNTVKDLSLDLGKVDTVDSVGLGLILAAHNTMTKRQGRLQLNNVPDNLFALFQDLGLDRHFEIEPL